MRLRFFCAVLLGLVAASASALPSCADPTAVDVMVYSEVPCAAGAEVAITLADEPSTLGSSAAAAVATSCSDTGSGSVSRGDVVLVPEGDRSKPVTFQITTRKDGLPLDACATSPASCIIARRQLRFRPGRTIDVRVDLRLACLGVTCPAHQTCIQGQCKDAKLPACDACGESDVGSGSDAGPPLDLCGDVSGLSRDAPWPLVHGCPTNSGRSKFLGPATGAARVAPTGSNAASRAVSVGPGGRAWVQESQIGDVYGFDGNTGSQLWTASLKGASYELGVAIDADNVAHAGTNYGMIYAVDATGMIAWNLQLLGGFSAPIIGAAGTLYVGSNAPYGFFAVDTVKHVTKWTYSVPNMGDATGAPTLGPMAVYFVDKTNSRLFALDQATGAHLYDVAIPGAGAGSAVLGVDALYVATATAGVVAFDPQTGAIKWQHAEGGKGVVQPALLGNGNVVSSTTDGGGFVLDYVSGELVRSLAVGANVLAPPVVDAADAVYFATDQGTIALRADTGDQLWRSAITGCVGPVCRGNYLAVGDGALFVLPANQTLAVIGP